MGAGRCREGSGAGGVREGCKCGIVSDPEREQQSQCICVWGVGGRGVVPGQSFDALRSAQGTTLSPFLTSQTCPILSQPGGILPCPLCLRKWPTACPEALLAAVPENQSLITQHSSSPPPHPPGFQNTEIQIQILAGKGEWKAVWKKPPLASVQLLWGLERCVLAQSLELLVTPKAPGGCYLGWSSGRLGIFRVE